tara:strand:+ start:22273 stop:22635 length:363 start_codon:yes stop_codon:yes gene_type:complete
MKNLILIVLLTSMLLLTACGGPKEASPELDTFAKCLTESGAKMFGAFWCPHCIQQKDDFGTAWQYIEYIECSTPDKQQTEFCKQQDITGYPTWQFADGFRRSGHVPLVDLAVKTGCKLPE